MTEPSPRAPRPGDHPTRDEYREQARHRARYSQYSGSHNWQASDKAALNMGGPPEYTQQAASLMLFGRAVSDLMRVRILALLVEEERPMYGQELAEHLSVTPQTISHHLHILKNGGLIREERENAYRYYSLDTENIQHLRETLFADNHFSLPTRQEGRERVLGVFFQDGRLVSIPKHRTQRRVVLEELAHSFEWGRLYDEREVNGILKQFYEDAASLRRAMIEEQIMLREDGRYWLVRPQAGPLNSGG
ncbi:MAG TPA: metalloregulator ArsR/SmtB family transcription factor [Ktedonobacterales bacterium]|jgi:biotin operon repressor